ncbi:hypothetical protein [Actinomadura pelletieri]|uniref:hypothetical protein n=1 Tax=Actinomadura pelletieri TaxID=111805 RepID=UPI000EB0B7A6|nr:hypothetical protein [Actinomadura pelletieri]
MLRRHGVLELFDPGVAFGGAPADVVHEVGDSAREFGILDETASPVLDLGLASAYRSVHAIDQRSRRAGDEVRHVLAKARQAFGGPRVDVHGHMEPGSHR